MRTVQERFEEKVEKGGGDDCWNWMAAKNEDGYGYFGLDGKIQKAHRVAYQLYVGKIPGGLCVCHRCDNPGCVNPGHLFLGTIIDNVRDCVNKGRCEKPFGENHWKAKLTEENARVILTMYADGALQIDLANKFGVSNQTISSIVCGHNWAKTLLKEKS